MEENKSEQIKDFKDISWQVTEEEYRADPNLSYSTLASFKRGGVDCIPKLFDKIESPSLTFGGAVDSIMTGGMDEFNSRYAIAEFPKIGEKPLKIVKELFETYKETYNDLVRIPSANIIEVLNKYDYRSNAADAKRVEGILREGETYYQELIKSNGKIILSKEDWLEVANTVRVLKSSKLTKGLFAENNPWEKGDMQRYYQLKFKSKFKATDDSPEIAYRVMADLIIVDYDKKIVYPFDLKTSGHPEYKFYESFKTWCYDIQARLYWATIRQNMDNDPYFKDFKLADYQFIVINKKSLTPMLWLYPDTKRLYDSIELNDGTVLTSPLVIGEELSAYLKENRTIPFGINIDGINNINDWI